MIRPNPNVAAMNPYALPDISAADGQQPIVLAQNEHAWPPVCITIGTGEQMQMTAQTLAEWRRARA